MSFVQGRITRIPTVISPKGLVDGASGRAGSAVYGDEARTRMAPDASSRGWGKAVYSEAAQRRRDGREELEDPVVVRARVEGHGAGVGLLVVLDHLDQQGVLSPWGLGQL